MTTRAAHQAAHSLRQLEDRGDYAANSAKAAGLLTGSGLATA